MACFMLIKVYKIICVLGKEKVGYVNFDNLVKSRNSIEFALPAKIRIQFFHVVPDPGLRRSDGSRNIIQAFQFLSWIFFPKGISG